MIDDAQFEEEEVVHRSVNKQVKQLDAILEEMKKQWNGIELKNCFDENGVRRHIWLIWCFGLMSGWRHTTLLNIVMNVIFGRAAARILLKELGLERPRDEHVGDDGSKIWCHPVVGPVIQAILDRLGYTGNPNKHVFAAEPDGIFARLREIHGSESDENTALLRRVAGTYNPKLEGYIPSWCSFSKVSNEQKPGCLVGLLG